MTRARTKGVSSPRPDTCLETRTVGASGARTPSVRRDRTVYGFNQ